MLLVVCSSIAYQHYLDDGSSARHTIDDDGASNMLLPVWRKGKDKGQLSILDLHRMTGTRAS